ncbi:DUF1681-domain-containing protein [Aulographum hederae CBS 113979]|uniref:DUF1681-domain-containing protein n=1 Tax=Aulographum hederae CBS 113979 TaxID=1176131 RepID=A0A6G1HCU7_9PEZI|nr:DUF1681-domain-containing protein [Aulographum hederae CBS 113979]
MTSTDPITNQPYPPDAIQRVLYIAANVHVYRIPPITSLKGFAAASWTANPADNIFNARLRIIETALPQKDGSEKVITNVLLEDIKTGDLFAACPYIHPSSVEQANDSSRFFAVRVVGGGGMKATLGIGFEDRSEAFDFSISLQDVRRVLDMDATPAMKKTGAGGNSRTVAKAPPQEEKKDFSLKEGEMITVNIGGKGRRGLPPSASKMGMSIEGDKQALFSIKPPPSSESAMPFLPPPPGASTSKAERRRSRSPVPPVQPIQDKASASDLGFDDGEFGEFQ